MIKNTTQVLRAQLGAPGFLKRAVLFAGGAVTGGIVSVGASYAVVSTLFPREAATAVIALTQPQPAPASREAAAVFTLASAPAAIAVTPLGPIADAPAGRPAVTASLPAQMPAPRPAAPGNLVFVTKSAPDVALPLPEPEAKSAPVVRLAPSIPQADDIAEDMAADRTDPAPVSPAALAALTVEAAAARTGATLDFAAPAAPAARPEVAVNATALADPALATIRPAPRPEVVPAVLAVVQDTSFAESIPGLRPQPRPEVIRVAAVTPAAPEVEAEAAPAPRRSGGLFGGGSGTCGRTLARAMPRRPGGAADGEAFFAALGGLSGSERDARVVSELAKGNMPGFLRRLEPVTLRGKDARGADTEIVICVTPDYLALGSDRDNVRVPLGLPAAARIAGRFDMTLPTPRMVDAIYAQADVKLSPAPMQAGPQMSSTSYFLRHDATIDGQLRGRGGLVAGQKKDVVMASRMASAPGRVAIYGWHRSGGRPIQPVSTVHGANYADYSHGIRLVSKTAYLNGKPVSLDELLGSSRYAYLLNKEGPLPGPVIRIASR